MPREEELLILSVFDKEKFFEVEKEPVPLAENKALVYRTFLPLNPYSVTFSKPRSVSFQQTAAPRRFIILDWGMDMLTMTIRGQTGRILPIQSPIQDIQDIQDLINQYNLNYEQLISLPLSPPSSSLNSFVSGVLFGRNEEQIITDLGENLKGNTINFAEYSKFRYLMFKLLEFIYQKFDANTQMMRINWMRKQYWGIITDFSHTIETGSLWNIKYEFTYKYLPEISFIEDLEYNKELIKDTV